MKKIIEYTTEKNDIGHVQFIDEVNIKIKEGWQPFGRVTLIFGDNHKETWVQTLVKYE